MNIQFENINCPFCSLNDGTVWAIENGFSAVKCNHCGFIYVNPRPARTLIKDSVEGGMHTYLEKPRSKRTRRIKKKVGIYRNLLKNLIDDVIAEGIPIRWLDVGAGYGEIVQAATLIAPPNSYVEGIEPMLFKAARARNTGLNVKSGYLDEVETKFNVISFINVFSHIDDINRFFKKCNELLLDSGQLIIETGNIADLKSPVETLGELDLPDHLMFAGEKHVEGLLEKYGFKIIKKNIQRRDTFTNFAISLIKKLLGRQTRITLPYTSNYRALIFRAQKISQV